MGLTSIDIGDMYLTVISNKNFTTRVRSLTFSEFWEVLVGCSQRAFYGHHVTDVEKLKCLFFYMWRSIEVSMSEQMKKDAINLSTTKGELIRGAQLLNTRFTTQWAKDDYRDYTLATDTTNPSDKTWNSYAKLGLENTPANHVKVIPSHSTATASFLDISADTVLGDERIDPLELRDLLDRKPDLLRILRKCLFYSTK